MAPKTRQQKRRAARNCRGACKGASSIRSFLIKQRKQRVRETENIECCCHAMLYVMLAIYGTDFRSGVPSPKAVRTAANCGCE